MLSRIESRFLSLTPGEVFKGHSGIFKLIIKRREGKSDTITGHEGPEGELKYCCIPSFSALNGGGRSIPRPGHLTPGKGIRYPLYRMLSGPQGSSGLVRKVLPPHRDSILRTSSRYLTAKNYAFCVVLLCVAIFKQVTAALKIT